MLNYNWNCFLSNGANIATIVVAIAAIIAGFLALKNITVLKEQRRIDTFLRLLDQMNSPRERENREIVLRLWISEQPYELTSDKTDIGQRIAEFIDCVRYQEGLRNQRDISQVGLRRKAAIEETIDSFDKIGFFLLGNPPKLNVDPKLKREAPIWIWSVVSEMWDELGKYVIGVQKGTFKRKVESESKAIPNYGKYFESLNKEATKHDPQKSKEASHVSTTG